MDWKGIGAKVMKSAPLIGTVLGGPAGGALGSVVSMVGSALGLEPDNTTPDAVDILLTQNPDALLQLKQAEMANRVELQKLALQSDQMYLQDRASARQREVDVVKATGQKDVNLYVLAWTVVLGFFALCVVLMRYELPGGSNEVVFMLFGGLVAGFSTVLQYFFGSSKSSTDKTNLLARNAHTPPLA